MIWLIKKKKSLSTPEYNELKFPILKLEAESSPLMMIERMRSVLQSWRYPDDWKIGKTISQYKTGDLKDSANYTPTTLTSILYRVRFRRIPEAMMNSEDRIVSKTIFEPHKKDIYQFLGCHVNFQRWQIWI
jgi:hypothetical protein